MQIVRSKGVAAATSVRLSSAPPGSAGAGDTLANKGSRVVTCLPVPTGVGVGGLGSEPTS